MMTECTSLLLAGIVVLSMLGINISALLLPAGVVLAIASRDLLQNLIAGKHTQGGTSQCVDREMSQDSQARHHSLLFVVLHMLSV